MKWDGVHVLDLCVSGNGEVAGTSKGGSEPSGSMKCEEFLD
jgi:hypothetical protein